MGKTSNSESKVGSIINDYFPSAEPLETLESHGLLTDDLEVNAAGQQFLAQQKQENNAAIIRKVIDNHTGSDDYLILRQLDQLEGHVDDIRAVKDRFVKHLLALKKAYIAPKNPASRVFGMLLGGVMGVFLGPVIAISASISRITSLVRHRELWVGKGALDVAYLIFKTLIELIFSPILGGFRGAKLGWRLGIRAGGSASLHYQTGLTYSMINKHTRVSFQLISVYGGISHVGSALNILSLSILLSAAVPLVVLSGVFPPLAIINMPVLAVISAAVLTVGVVAAGMTYAVTRFRQARKLDEVGVLSTDDFIVDSHSFTNTAGESSGRSFSSVNSQISQGDAWDNDDVVEDELLTRTSVSRSPSSSRRSSMSDSEDDWGKSALDADKLTAGHSVDSSMTSGSGAIPDPKRQARLESYRQQASSESPGSMRSNEDDDWTFGDDQYDSSNDQDRLRGFFRPDDN